MSSATTAENTDPELVTRLGHCLRAGTILDLQGAVIPADLLRAALIGQSYGDGGPVIDVVDIDPRGLLITNAAIRGHLDVRNAAISSAVTITDSVLPDGINFRDAHLNRGLSLRGSVIGSLNLLGAVIAGTLALGGAQLIDTDRDGDSLVADGVQVDGGAYLDNGFTAAGAIRLPGARITRQLVMGGAQLNGTEQDGYSLVADGLHVHGGALLGKGFTAAGAIRLSGAHITGQLGMGGAQLNGTDQNGHSLVADGLQVDNGAYLDNGFTAAGAIRLPGAQITGQLSVWVEGIRARTVGSPALVLTGAMIDDPSIDLRRVDWINRPRFRPNPGSLPARRVVLSLENCTYKHRPDPQLGGVETWLRVLRFHTVDYQPRAYQQLAAVHRATGHDRDAARILMAQQDHRRAVALRPRPGAGFRQRFSLWMSRAGLGFWKATLGYGYRPRRALGWLLALLATAGLLVSVATHLQADLGKPDVPVAYRPGNPAAGTPPEYCSFGEAAGLAVRIAIPLVTNLGQGTCIVNTATIPGSIIVTASIALQTFAWILGGLTIAAAATAIKRSP